MKQNAAEKKSEQAVWEKELGTFLDVTTGEIKLSMKDASDSINNLTKTFMEMVRDVHEIKALTQALEKSPQDKESLKQIQKVCDTYLDKVQSGTVGFQFYDKLTQRLKHSADGMEKLRRMLSSQTDLEDTATWNDFRHDLKTRYNTEKDRQFYEALMNGSSIKEAISIALDAGERTKEEGSVELF